MSRYIWQHCPFYKLYLPNMEMRFVAPFCALTCPLCCQTSLLKQLTTTLAYPVLLFLTPLLSPLPPLSLSPFLSLFPFPSLSLSPLVFFDIFHLRDASFVTLLSFAQHPNVGPHLVGSHVAKYVHFYWLKRRGRGGEGDEERRGGEGEEGRRGGGEERKGEGGDERGRMRM